MTRGTINPGICGRVTNIEVVETEQWRVRLKLDSDCDMVTKMGESLTELDLRDALKSQVDSIVYKLASEYCSHASCPVPMAILKTMEVEAGMALPKSVLFTFEPGD